MARKRSARISLITDRETVPDGQRHHYDRIKESRGKVTGPLGALLHSPEVAGRTSHLGAYIRYESELSGPERELAIITTAREHDCAYEWAVHEPLAREAGVNEEAIEAVLARESVTDLTETEAAIVRFGRETIRDHEVTDQTFETVEDRFSVQEMTELTATIGYYSMMACVLNAFEVKPDDTPQLF